MRCLPSIVSLSRLDKLMAEPIVLTAIKAPIKEGYVVIPHGMKPIYLHTLNGQVIAYVKGWTAPREYDQNWYDLYLLGDARHFVLVSKLNNEAPTNEDWFADFGEASKEAMKDGSGSLVIRERVG